LRRPVWQPRRLTISLLIASRTPQNIVRQTLMSLQQTLDAFKASFEAGGSPHYAPPWVHELIHRATDELIASGAAGRALKAGAHMPDFRLFDSYGAQVSSSDLLAKGPVVLSFYRGAWCPYCNLELSALEACLPEIVSRGAKLVAISPQTQANSRLAARENRVSFPILSDPRNRVAAAFGLRFKLPDFLIDLYRNFFRNDLAIINGDNSWRLPMPARFVIARDGAIIYAEVNPDYTHRSDPQGLLPALEKARALS
jgi:peroxiredoxin